MKSLILLSAVMVAGFCAAAQVKIGDNPGVVSPGSLLELESTGKALTLPRMTTVQMQAIPSPQKGMIIFNTDSNCIYFYRAGNTWAGLVMGAASSTSNPWPYHTNDSTINEAGNGKGIISLTGTGLVASGNYSHAEGMNSRATGNYSFSFGNTDTASGTSSVAIGTQNKAQGIYSMAAGYKNIAAYQSAVALGQENRDSGWASLAAGLRNDISDGVSYSNAMGYMNRVAGGSSHHAFGENNTIQAGKANSVMGFSNTAAGNYNNLFGNNNQTITGNANLLSGEKNKVTSGNFNASIGYNNNASGNYNLLSGNNNLALAGNGNLLSGDANLLNGGHSNVLIGQNNSAEASFSAAIGKDNIVFYQSAVAMGQGNRDSGWASVTGGLTNTIRQNVRYSTSFGMNNISGINEGLLLTSPGAATFSAGIGNLNTGYGSIALGAYTRSGNLYSMAVNNNTISNGYAMSSFGHYNDTISAYPGENYQPLEILFSIGNGTNANNRRNSLTMLRNGFTSINTFTEAGPAVPRAELDVKGTGALIVPVGTTAQRPEAPVIGMIRLCTDCRDGGPVLQGYNGTSWVDL